MNNRNKLLSNTEIRIIRLIIQGNCNKDIAKELFLSESSIKKYISMINYNLNNITRKIEAVDLMRYKLLYSPSNIKIHSFPGQCCSVEYNDQPPPILNLASL